MTSKAPLFSVVIATFNSSKFIIDCVNSVLVQTYRNYEIIIVDDNSTDDSVNVLHSLFAEKVKIFKNDKNHGCGFTFDRGIKESKGSIIGLLGSDDSLKPNAIADIVAAYSGTEKIVGVYSSSYDCDEHLTILRERKWKRGHTNQRFTRDYLPKNVNFQTFLREAYLENVGDDILSMRNGIDLYIYMKLEKHGMIKYLAMPIYLFRLRSDSVSRSLNPSNRKVIIIKWIDNQIQNETSCVHRLLLRLKKIYLYYVVFNKKSK